MEIEITRRQIFDIWSAHKARDRFNEVLSFFMKTCYRHYHISFSKESETKIKSLLRTLCFKIEEKWDKYGRHRERFLNNSITWLSEKIILPDSVVNEIPSSSSSKPVVVGRPVKSFHDSCEKTKKRKIQTLLETTSPEEIAVANECNLRKAGKRDSAAIVKELSMELNNSGTDIKKARRRLINDSVSLSVDEALGMMIEAKLSTYQYNIIRQKVNKLAKNLLPSYDQIKEGKKQCYPLLKTVAEPFAECNLQSLVDHTIKRICLAQKEVLDSIEILKVGAKELTCLIKWGCDGAQQKRYKQKFTSENEYDENLFSSSMVPIQMSLKTEKDDNIIVWQNPAPSSPRYCRPIKLNFTKETTELIQTEVDSIQKQIDVLTPTEVHMDEILVFVKPIFMLTMIDGKVCNALATDPEEKKKISQQTCYICEAKPSEMNKPPLLSKKTLNPAAMSFGLSPLHSWIRFMECILHIAYRLDIKSWQARGMENKSIVKKKKELIQKRFKDEIGLLVDMPNQQSGNTNDGNTARRFFRNTLKTADITGVNFQLIHRFHIILEILGSGFAIDANAFDLYSRETMELYLKEYSWYNMPVSVHKVLCHGKDVISSCILPIGQLSEEAQEARNKDNRYYREFFTRKTSRIDTNTDLLNRLLISSDPYLASLRCIPKRTKSQIEPEVLTMLLLPTAND